MVKEGFEAPPSSSGDSENSEDQPSEKHTVAIEYAVTEKTERRSEFLHQALTGDWETKNEEGFSKILNHWEKELPEHSGVIQELAQKGDIRSFGAIILKAKNEVKIKEIQELCKAVLQTDGKKTWQDLPEGNKRSVRLAEMMIFLTDAMRISIDINRRKQEPAAWRNIINKMEAYSETTDVPKTFKKGFLNPITQSLRREDKYRRNVTPWEYGNLGSLWGKHPKQPASTVFGNFVHQPGTFDEGTIRDVDTPPPKKLPDTSGDSRSPHSQEEEVIDMKYNPSTDSYEPADGSQQNNDDKDDFWQLAEESDLPNPDDEDFWQLAEPEDMPKQPKRIEFKDSSPKSSDQDDGLWRLTDDDLPPQSTPTPHSPITPDGTSEVRPRIDTAPPSPQNDSDSPTAAPPMPPAAPPAVPPPAAPPATG